MQKSLERGIRESESGLAAVGDVFEPKEQECGWRWGVPGCIAGSAVGERTARLPGSP